MSVHLYACAQACVPGVLVLEQCCVAHHPACMCVLLRVQLQVYSLTLPGRGVSMCDGLYLMVGTKLGVGAPSHRKRCLNRNRTWAVVTRRYGRRSWRPWWISLGVDLLSGHFSRRGRLLLQQGAGAGSKGGLHCASGPSGALGHCPPTSLLSVALIRCVPKVPATGVVATPTENQSHPLYSIMIRWSAVSTWMEELMCSTCVRFLGAHSQPFKR